MNQLSLLLMRTQGALRTLGRLDDAQTYQLEPVAAQLALMEQLLLRIHAVPDEQLETILSEFLETRLISALKSVERCIAGEDGS